MAATLLLWFLYAGVCAAAAAGARWLKRSVRLPFLLIFFLLPVLFLLPGFTGHRTALPVDHMLFPPWGRPGVAIEAHNIFLNDAATQMAPWAKAVRMAWKEGSLPLRDRWNGAGTPLAANGQSAAFSPLTVLMFGLPLARAFTLLAALKLFFALAGTWLWLKEIGVSEKASLFGSIAFSFSLTMAPWLLFPVTSVVCFWPWVFFAAELLRREETRRRALPALVALLVLCAVNGHPESAASGATFFCLWLLARRALSDLPDFVPFLRRLSAGALLALGLSAFLVLPIALAIRASNRAANASDPFYAAIFSWAPHGPAWGNGLFTPFFPRLFGDGVHSPMIEGAGGSFPEMALAYFGIAGWAAVLLAPRPGSPRSRAEWSLLVPFLFGLFAAIGLWPFAEIAGLVPGLRLMFSLRFFSWVALAGAAVAAFELDRLNRDLSSRRPSAVLFPIAVAAGLALFALAAHARFRALHEASGGLPSQKHALTIALAVLAAFALAVLLAAWKRERFLLLPAASIVVCAELFLQGTRLYRYGSPAEVYPLTPAVEFLRAQSAPFRVAGIEATLFPNSNVFAELEDIRTHDAVERRDYVLFLDRTAGYPPGDYFKHLRDLNAPSLDFLNVRFLIAPYWHPSPGEKWKAVYSGPDARVFENARVFPRVFAPRNVRLVRSPAGRRRLAPSNAMDAFGDVLPEIEALSDFREKAFLLAPPGDHGGFSSGPQPEGVTAGEYRESVNSASFRARNPSPGRPAVLVASLVQDGGWSARDARGAPLPTALANGPFLALSIPPGEHWVFLHYRPPGFTTGAAVSLATAAGCAFALFWARRGKRAVSKIPPVAEIG